MINNGESVSSYNHCIDIFANTVCLNLCPIQTAVSNHDSYQALKANVISHLVQSM